MPSPRLYRSANPVMLRAAARAVVPLPSWPVVPEAQPDVTVDQWRAWLAEVWSDPATAEAVQYASPVLAERVQAAVSGAALSAKRARRAALSLAGYAVRASSRATPFGTFAGVNTAAFGPVTDVRVGLRHRVEGRVDPVFLQAAITKLESDHTLMSEVRVCANTLCRVRDGRLITPASGTSEFSLRLTDFLELVLEAAASPLTCGELAGKLAAQFPTATAEHTGKLLEDLLHHRVLVSELHAPATDSDPLGHLLAVLAAAGADCSASTSALLDNLEVVHQAIAGITDAQNADERGRLCRTAQRAMTRAIPETGGHPGVDLKVDVHVALPAAVASEIEAAATLLTRLAVYPAGTPAWARYTNAFADRYGEGVLVGVPELTDPDTGLGFPVETAPATSDRDRALLALAGAAALEGTRRIKLTADLVNTLETAAGGPAGRIGPHLEMCVQVLAASAEAVDRGQFRIRVLTASRAVGAMAGRFLPLLGHNDRLRFTLLYGSLPTVQDGSTVAQLSFHPARIAADSMTRTVPILPAVISIGEHRPTSGVLRPKDLAVGLRDGRLFLACRVTGQVVEPLAATALNLRMPIHTAPLARFLAEIARSGCAQVTGFDWGAALALPFTPELHVGRTTLIPARWRIEATELPGRQASLTHWTRELHALLNRRRAPLNLVLAEADQHLLLDLETGVHSALLRQAVHRASRATLLDAPPPDGNGWIGGLAHALLAPMIATAGRS
ncbi:lantibiotic dehydratase family protein [Catenulispora pinisilvae]|uniref:lantibiotic dehydratase family protein n=1 Tax=Catenulispora pinisilvae TaxID=2705253 RepID=UPI0018926A59|nr:lantibiotic dehydratase family protein [Catenulispora pinisilvae]